MKSLKARYGDWAIVTGGSSGIGAELTKEMAAAGINIVLVARGQKVMDEHATLLKDTYDVHVRTVATDLGKPQGVDALFEATADLEIGILIPCAAIERKGYFVDFDRADHVMMVQMDMVAPMLMAHHYGRKMAKRGKGAILFVSSMSGWFPQAYMAHYSAVKAYILALGDSLHYEMKELGVDVTVLSPGPVDTPMTKDMNVGKLGMSKMKPSVVARTALAALGYQADTIPGCQNSCSTCCLVRCCTRGCVGCLFQKMLKGLVTESGELEVQREKAAQRDRDATSPRTEAESAVLSVPGQN